MQKFRQKLEEINLLFNDYNDCINTDISDQILINKEIRDETGKARNFIGNLNNLLEVKRFEAANTDAAIRDIYREVNGNIKKSVSSI